MIKVKKIKDNIHGYIYYSGLEQLFISHPLVLRMHHIRQNGGAYLTYPSIRVHRYEHSLGAMHLCGMILLNAIKFSPDPDIRATIKEAVQTICREKLTTISTSIQKTAVRGDVSFFTDDGLYRYNEVWNINDEGALALLFLYQAARIAMLVHDIGHPPFSHTMEMALKQLDVDYDDHERVGLELLDVILDDIQDECENAVFTFARHVSAIVRAIVDKDHEHHLLLAGVSEIVSGDFDADRLDYVRRDALAGGLSTNSYDVGRLLDAIKLVTISAGTQKTIGIQYYAQALSTLEAFFSMRFHLYRWMLWHHSVILQNMNIVNIVHRFHQLCRTHISGLSERAEELIDVAINKQRRAEYWYFTDFMFLWKLVDIYNYLVSHPALINSNLSLFTAMRVFLFRKKGLILPFWKTPDNYVDFAEAVLQNLGRGGGNDPAAEFNQLLTGKYDEIKAATRARIQKGELKQSSDNLDFHSREFCCSLEDSVRSHMPANSGRIQAYYLAKFKPAPEEMLLISAGQKRPLGMLSPSIPALQSAWQALPHLWIFLDRCLQVSVENGRVRHQLSSLRPEELVPTIAPAIANFLRPAGAA